MSTQYNFQIRSSLPGYFLVVDPMDQSHPIDVPSCSIEHCVSFLTMAVSQFTQFTGVQQKPYKYRALNYVRALLHDPELLQELFDNSGSLDIPHIEVVPFDPDPGSGSVH